MGEEGKCVKSNRAKKEKRKKQLQIAANRRHALIISESKKRQIFRLRRHESLAFSKAVGSRCGGEHFGTAHDDHDEDCLGRLNPPSSFTNLVTDLVYELKAGRKPQRIRRDGQFANGWWSPSKQGFLCVRMCVASCGASRAGSRGWSRSSR